MYHRAMTVLEVCVDSLDALQAAQGGGAQRIELCERLDLGGLSPSRDLLEQASAVARVPLMVMVRPRAGDFVYTLAELDAMERELATLRELGVSGAVLGALTTAGDVDRAALERLLRAARPLDVTFHRAFDEARDLFAALDVLMDLGIDRVLTSGGKPDAFAGRGVLRALVERASGRMVVMAGGGVREHNVRSIVAATHVLEVHSSTWFRMP